VKNIVIKYAFLQGMLIPYSIQNGFIYLSTELESVLFLSASHPTLDFFSSSIKWKHSLRKGRTFGTIFDIGSTKLFSNFF
jgi:hypothetical protein